MSREDHVLVAAMRAAMAAAALLVCAGLAAAQPVPTATLSVPSETVLGEPLVFTATFDNTSATSTGYGPYLDVILPATGADGAGNETDDGITFVGASYKGAPVSTVVLTFDASGNVTHPYARDASGAPLVVTGTPGDQLVVFQLPFPAVTPEQPAIPLQITASVSPLADSNVALAIAARAGFRFGADAVDNATDDPTIVGAPVSASVTPTVLRLRKVYVGAESETVTGPNYPVRYRIEVDIADGQTVTDLDLTDVLPANLQFVSVDGTTPATATAISTPSTLVPGGTLTRRFASVTGSTSDTDAALQFTAFVPRTAAGGTAVLDPATGAGAPALDDARAQGTWTPVDTRDTPGPVVSDATAVDHTLAVRAIAVQKHVAIVSDSSPNGPSPTDVVEYTLDVQVSDFFALQNVVLTDTIGDGLRRAVTFTPRLRAIEHGTTSDAAMAAANFAFVVDPGTGVTTATFRISDELVARGLNGHLLGGCVPDGGTGGPPPVCAVTNQGPTTFRLTYRVAIQQAFTAGGPVLGGDVLNNAVDLTADVVSTDTLTPTGSSTSDSSAQSLTIRIGQLRKTIYALNGNTTLPPAIVLTPGDTLTYRITGSVPATDTGDITLTDYLPAPIFDQAEVTTFNATVSAAPPPAGVAKFGPEETFFGISGAAPTLTNDPGGNSVSFALPPFSDPQNRTTIVDLLLTVTATTVPAADGLAVTNLVRAIEETTGSSALGDAIVQLTLTEPNVSIEKGVVATTNPAGQFSPATVGPVTFTAPGSPGYRGSGPISSAGLRSLAIDSNLARVDAGDLVTFAIVLENTGTSDAGAFDVRVRDTLPAGFAIPAGGAGLNLHVTNGTGTAVPFTTIGSGLFDATGGLDLTDGATGALAGADPSSGLNVVVITYDLQVAADAQPTQVLTNTATLFNFAGAEGAEDHTGTDRTDAATTTVAPPIVTKAIVTTSQAHTGGAGVAIGEQVTYQVVARIPEGTATAVTLVDTLPAGMAFVALASTTISPGLTIGGSLVPVVAPGGQNATFNLGMVTNANRDDATDETIGITFTAVVLNGGGNDRGDTLVNGATLSFTGGSVSGSSPAVMVVEPTLQTVKTVSPTTGDAGDTVTFSIVLSHAPGSNADAFDVTFSDPVPAGFTFVDILPVTGLQPASIALSGGAVTASWTAFPAGSTSTVQFRATVDPGIAPGQAIANTATTRWTSLPGDVTTAQSPFNAVSTERTGNPANPGGADNDYVATGAATFTGRTATAAKTIVSTSLPSTTGTTLAIGERVQYQVQVVIPEGVSSAATFTDTLEPGLAFLSFDSITASAALSTSVPGGFPAVLANGVVSNVGGGPANDGRQVVFDAGVLTNADTDNLTAEKVTIVYTAVVLNTAANVRGTVSNNTMVLGSAQFGQTLPGPDVTLAEATLQVVKTAAPTLADAGDVVTVTLTVSHTAASNAEAYDAVLTDVVPAGLTYVPASLAHAGGLAPSALSFAGSTVTVTYSAFPLGTTSVIQFRARLETIPTPVTPGEVLTNTAALAWTSLPGAATTPQSTFNSLSTERTGSTVDPGGAANTYTTTESETVTVASSQISGFVYVDATNDGIKGAMEPGIAGVHVALTGTDHLGTAVSRTADTLADGAYVFASLRPGTYTLTESQPPGYADGLDTVGTPPLGATAGNDVLGTITLPPQTNTTTAGFNFGERATADLSITKTDAPDPVQPGGTLVYALRLTNAGPNPAFDAVFTDPLPGGTTFVSLSAPGWTCTTPAPGSAGNIGCTLAQFAPGSVDFTLTVLVDPGVVIHSTIRNAATITSSSTDPNPANNRADEPTTVAAPTDADLEVIKTDAPDPVATGQDVTYTVTVRNSGPAATDATLTDTLPAGLTLVSASASVGTCTGSAPMSCALGTLAPGATATVTVVATATTSGVFTNTASVTGTQPDPNPANNTASATTTAAGAGEADVAVVKTGPATVARGSNVTYTIVATNNGPVPATSVSLADTPPAAGVTFLANAGDCTTPFPCVLGTLNPGESRRVTSTFAVSAAFPGTSLVNQSAVTSATPDPNPANNTSQATSVVAGPSDADLAIVKFDSPDAAVAGTAVVYTMIVTNNGPSPAIGVQLTDDLPTGVTLESITSSQGSCSGQGPIACDLGDIPSGANATIGVTVRVDSTFPAPGTIVNLASVSATSADPDPLNNIAVQPTGIVARADVSILKTGPPTATAGGAGLVYSIVVSNAGPSDAANVVVADPLPAGLVFSANTGDCATAFPCALGTIPAGETRTIVAAYTVPSSYVAPDPIVNTATVATTTVDTNLANNTSTAGTALVREADLGITKTGPAAATAGAPVQYLITITNAGPSDAISAQVADPAPPGLSFQVNTGDCATAFPCTFAALPVGASRTFTSQFMVASGYTAPDPIVNTATVSAVTTDPQPANNTAIASTPLGPPSADLVVTQTGPALAIPGTSITYTITLFNAGPSDAASVSLADPTPTGLVFQSAAGDCTTAFPCAFGTLSAGAHRTVQVTFLVPAGYVTPDPFANVATASTTTTESNLANNTATVLTSVGADLRITKTAAPEPVAAGELLTFVMTATNGGARDAVDMTIADTLPRAANEVISSTASTDGVCGITTASSGDVSVHCTWPGITPAGASHQLLIVVRVSRLTPEGTVLTNTAVTSSQTNDPNPANNTATSTSTVTAPAGLTITKTGPAFTTPGTPIVYTLVVANRGAGDASAVVVEDPTPAGLTFVSNTGDCTIPFPCLLPIVPAGASRTITSTFLVPADYTSPNPIVNVASLPFPASLAGAPERRAIAVTALAGTDVSIVKSGGPSPGIRGSQVPFTLVVRNLGPLLAEDVRVTDPTPDGYTVFSMGGACSAFPCALGTLNPGDERTIQVVYLQDVDVPAAAANIATVTTTTFDPVLANNISSAPLRAGPDLMVTKAGPPTAVPGQLIDYTVVVTNVGSSDAEAVVVNDPTPAGTTFVMSSGACTAGFPCTIERLRVNESQRIEVVLEVAAAAAAGSVVENVVTVTASMPDPTPLNNRAAATTTIQNGDPCGADSGLPPGFDPNADDDGDGATNGDECGRDHPRGFFKRYLPEGATGSFYHAAMTIQSAGGNEVAHVLVHFDREGEGELRRWLRLLPGARTTIDLTPVLGLKSFSTWLESDVDIAVERTMTWLPGGATADTADDRLAPTWYFAEGATTGGFQTHYLLENPGPVATDVAVTFFTNAGPVERTYTVPPSSRTSLWANAVPELSGTDLAVAVRSLGSPIAAARAMYRDWNGQLHVAGSSASGSSELRSDWYFAEAATGGFFDTWLLIANPSTTATTADVTYLLSSGSPITKTVAIAAQSRISVRVNDVDPRLATGAAGMHVHVTGAAPIVAERSVWWPSPNYYEGHQTSGAPRPAPAWRFGRGLVDAVSRTYVLIANFGAEAGQVLVTFTFDDGTTVMRALDVGAMSRTTIDVGTMLPDTVGEGFRIDVASLGRPLPLVAERSIYSDSNGRLWGSGTSIVGYPAIAITDPPLP